MRGVRESMMQSSLKECAGTGAGARTFSILLKTKKEYYVINLSVARAVGYPKNTSANESKDCTPVMMQLPRME